MGMHRMSTMKRQQLAIALAGLGMMGVARGENKVEDATETAFCDVGRRSAVHQLDHEQAPARRPRRQ
jgi:hypothetical protein